MGYNPDQYAVCIPALIDVDVPIVTGPDFVGIRRLSSIKRIFELSNF